MHVTASSPSNRRLLLKGHIVIPPGSSFHVLLLASDKFLLNEEATAILHCCDGTWTKAQIIVQITDNRPRSWSARLVEDFLNAAIRMDWIDEGLHRNAFRLGRHAAQAAAKRIAC